MFLAKAKKTVTLLALLALPGCMTYSLEELRHTTPKGTPFQTALAKLYLDFAASEEKDYDWFSSMHFADKGLKAAYGKDVVPEDPANWHIPVAVMPDLQKARETLLAAMTPSVIEVRPQLAAEAQFYFDCWVEQQEENWQMDDIAYCRNGLAESLKALSAPVAEVQKIAPPEIQQKAKAKTKKEQAKAKKNKTKPVAKPVAADSAETVSYIVFFESGQPILTESGKKVLADVAKSLAGKSDYEVVLNADARASGNNSKLSEARIAAVRKRLQDGGAKDAAIVMAGHSKNAAKRRVEIFLNQ